MPITLEHVSYTYDIGMPSEKKALKDVSLEIGDNSFICMIGETGSGKSTLIQHLNALLLPSEGVVKTAGVVIDMAPVYKKNGKIDKGAMKKKAKKRIADVKTLRKTVGLVFQFPEYQIFEDTVIKDVSFGPRNFGLSQEESEEKARKALEVVGIDASYYERSPFELSGGEKRRVAIAGILALEPDILVLDEPTVGLDRDGVDSLMSLLVKIHSEGKSVIIATHDMDIVLKYAERAIVLNDGEIVFDSTPLELFRNEQFLLGSSIKPPKVFDFAEKLIENGLDIDINKVKDASSLAEEIVRVKKR